METSWCRCRINLPGKHANIARSWDLFPKYASSTHLKSKTTAYIHIYVSYKYPLKQNCHIFPRFGVKSTWFDSLLCHFALFHSTAYPPLVSCIPRWGMPKLRCPRNDSLDNDDTEKSLCLSTLHKWNQQIWHRSRTPIFLSFLSAVDRKSVRIYCALRRLFTVSVSRLKVITTHIRYVFYKSYYVLWSTCFVCIADENASFISWSVMLFTRLVNTALTRYFA